MSLRRFVPLFVLLVGLACVPGEAWAQDAASDDTVTTSASASPESASPESASLDSAPSNSAAADSVAPDSVAPDSVAVASAAEASSEPSSEATGESSAASEGASSDAESDAEDGDRLKETQEAIQNYAGRIFLAILLLALTFLLVRTVVYGLDTYAERNAERRLLLKRLVPIVRIILWSMALYVVLRIIFDVNAENLLAAATAIGVAVGFAAQDLLKNVFGGLVIIFDTPFQVGDKISVGGTYGEVVTIGLRSTRIVTPDDNLVSVPNAQVVDGQVSNANAGALDCQVVTDLYLPAWADETRAKKIAYQAAASSKFVYLAKPIAVIVKDEFKEAHVLHLKVKAYVLDARYEFLLASDVTERARRVFRAEGLIPTMTRATVDVPASGSAPGSASGNASGSTPTSASPAPSGDGAEGPGSS